MVDISSGYFGSGKAVDQGKLVDSPRHPDTGVLMEGMLPHWSLIKEKITQIGAYIPQVRWMGLDIVITDEGFKIIEINSHPGISFIQYGNPFFKDELSKDFVLQLLEEKKGK